MADAIKQLLDILNLENLEQNLFRGTSPQQGWQRVFGGQVIGQALVAAQRTVDSDRHVHSLHGYFMRPGDPKVPIIYEVDRIRDGRSFATRRVVAIQHGHAIFSMSASFQVDEDGLNFQMDMSDVPQPENLLGEKDLKDQFLEKAPEHVKAYWEQKRPIELRPVALDHYMSHKKLEPQQNVWVRTTAPIPEDRGLNAAILAYASDMTLLDTSLFPHGRNFFDKGLQIASLDHAMWFHRPIKFNDWLLYAQDCPSTSGARGFNRGKIYSRDGVLLASTAQEGLIREHKG
jgi:acyl-CoA thioesterase-2